MEEDERFKELVDDVIKNALIMKIALRRDVCAKCSAMPSDAKRELHKRLVSFLPSNTRRCADALCLGGITNESLDSDPELAQLVDSGTLVEPMLEVTGGMRRSFLSLQAIWEHMKDWRDSASEAAATCSNEWDLLASLGTLGLPIEVKRAACDASPFAIEVTRVCATPADTSSFVAALRAKNVIVPPEGGVAVEDLLVLVDPDAPRASRIALSSKLMKEYVSMVFSRKLHCSTGLQMHLALHAHALFNVVQPPARGVRKEDLEAQMRRQYFGRAYQCAQCCFGPIDHFACGDLAAHNGQQVGNATINNSCPRCGWFSKLLSAWPKWDGTVPDEALLACTRSDEDTVNMTVASAEIALRICYSARALWDPSENGEARELCKKLADWRTLTFVDGVEHPVQLLLALAITDELPEEIFGPVPIAQLLNEACARRAADEMRRVDGQVARRRVGAFLGVSFFSAPQPSHDSALDKHRAAVVESCRSDYAIDPDAFDFKSWVRGALTPWAYAILFVRRLRKALGQRTGGWRKFMRDMEAGPRAYADIISNIQRPACSRDMPAALLGVRCKEDSQRVLATVCAQAFLHHSPQSRRTNDVGGLLEEPLGDVRDEHTLRCLCVELRMSYYDEALAAKQRVLEEMRKALANQHVHSLSKAEFWKFWQNCASAEDRLFFLASANEGFVNRHAGR